LRSSLRYACLLLAALFLAACQQSAPQRPEPAATGAVEVRKSPNDDRQYRYLELDNRLKLLLVSDPTTDKAAASLVVFRGSYHEPAEYPGLAHFLEHMLFIGTEKYPEVDAYQQFIGQHGGSSNAYTAGDHTNYFFDIQPAYFGEAMDRFAQFFIAPLFAADYVEREKNAVHSEYQMQIRADNWRANAVLNTAINPAHPRARFNIGSLETLGDGVQEALVEMFDSQYSADQMALVALSSAPLDELEQMIRPMFEAIPNRNIGPAPASPPLFADGQLPAVLTFRSIKDGYSVSYNFPVPATTPHYAEKPADYLTNLLGHEGEGSLHQALLARGWIESLSAGSWDIDERSGLLGVDIELTPAGYANLDAVTDLVFDFIERVRAATPEEWRYREQAEVAELGFRFQEKSSATGFVYQVAPRLMQYPPGDVLIAPYLMTDFDRALIADYLARLTPDNLLMTVSGPDVETDSKERWFDVAYRLERREPTRAKTAAPGLQLPEPNRFLPDRLDVLAEDPALPAPAVARPGLALWLDRDTEFGTPRADLRLSLGIPDGISTAEDRAFALLYVALVEDALSARVYPAYLAGLGYSLDVDGYGLELAVNGYSDKQIELLEVVLDGVTGLVVDPARFAVIRDRLLRDWQNYREERPYTQTLGAVNYLLLSDAWPPEALRASLADRTPADLERWRDRRLGQFNVQGLLHGNVADGEGAALADAIDRHLPLADFARRAPEVREVDAAVRYPIEVAHDDAAIVIYLQDAERTLASRARTALAASILRQAYFTSLRTEQQLGYVVAATNQTLRDRGGLAFIVQSPVASSAELARLTHEFLAAQVDAVAAMPDDEFVRFREGLIARLTERDRNLGERASRLWGDLDLGFTSFDSRDQIAAEVAKLGRDQIVEYLREVLVDFDGRSLVTYAPGKFPEVPQTGQVITDVTRYKHGG
jgi:secreted Zn-dependent insulinase-like peptidase